MFLGFEKCGQLRSVGTGVFHEARKTLLERAGTSSRVPDEVADSERSEIFAGVPGGQACDGPTGLIFPNFVSDPPGLVAAQGDPGQGGACQDNKDERGRNELEPIPARSAPA